MAEAVYCGYRHAACRGGRTSSNNLPSHCSSGPFTEQGHSPAAKQREVRVLAGSITAKRSVTVNYRTRDSPANPTFPVTSQGRGLRGVAGGYRLISLTSRLPASKACHRGRVTSAIASGGDSFIRHLSTRRPSERGKAFLTAHGSSPAVRRSTTLVTGGSGRYCYTASRSISVSTCDAFQGLPNGCRRVTARR